MKPVLIAQNCTAETAGTIIEYLDSREIPCQVVHTYDGQPLPSLDDVVAVINLGCPISVVDYHQHDYLKALYEMVCEAVRIDKPYLGICFGGQILARALGANVSPNRVRQRYRSSNGTGIHSRFPLAPTGSLPVSTVKTRPFAGATQSRCSFISRPTRMRYRHGAIYTSMSLTSSVSTGMR